MNLIQLDEKLQAEHGVVADYADEFFGYFGWPTVARMEDGTLIVSSSGLRNYHVLARSDGRSSAPAPTMAGRGRVRA